MMPKRIQSESVEIRRLRQVMLTKRLSPGALGRKAKFNPRRISNVLCGTDTTWPIRAAINRALREKVFTKPMKKHLPGTRTIRARITRRIDQWIETMFEGDGKQAAAAPES